MKAKSGILAAMLTVALPRLEPPKKAENKEESPAVSQTNGLSTTNNQKNMGHFGGEGSRTPGYKRWYSRVV